MVRGPCAGILKRGHDADAVFAANADEIHEVRAKRGLVCKVGGIAEKNANLIQIEPPGVIHVARRFRRTILKPHFVVADGGRGFIIKATNFGNIGNVPLCVLGGAKKVQRV